MNFSVSAVDSGESKGTAYTVVCRGPEVRTLCLLQCLYAPMYSIAMQYKTPNSVRSVNFFSFPLLCPSALYNHAIQDARTAKRNCNFSIWTGKKLMLVHLILCTLCPHCSFLQGHILHSHTIQDATTTFTELYLQ